eukprot:gene9596-19300_t
MAAMGITVMVSSGDDGSGHDSRQGTNSGKVAPSFPASIPYVVSVGATYFVDKTAMSGEEEATTQFGSGGGFDFTYPITGPTSLSSDTTAAKLGDDALVPPTASSRPLAITAN